LYKLQGSAGRQENYDRSNRGVTPKGDVGVEYQLDIFDRHGLKAVFFVDSMPSLIWGVQSITDIVEPIIERGHDVQLHLFLGMIIVSMDIGYYQDRRMR
jgi:hypothetical protein